MISIMITENEILKRVAELGSEIKKDYLNEDLVLIGVLRGSILFMSDLSKHLDPKTTEFEFLQVNSYSDNESTGKVSLVSDIVSDIKGKNAIIIEDILDTGITLDFIINHIKSKNPKSLKVCTLLNKGKVDHIQIDYIGFKIPNKFVIGYGLDYNNKFRNLTYIGNLTEG